MQWACLLTGRPELGGFPGSDCNAEKIRWQAGKQTCGSVDMCTGGHGSKCTCRQAYMSAHFCGTLSICGYAEARSLFSLPGADSPAPDLRPAPVQASPRATDRSLPRGLQHSVPYKVSDQALAAAHCAPEPRTCADHPPRGRTRKVRSHGAAIRSSPAAPSPTRKAATGPSASATSISTSPAARPEGSTRLAASCSGCGKVTTEQAEGTVTHVSGPSCHPCLRFAPRPPAPPLPRSMSLPLSSRSTK